MAFKFNPFTGTFDYYESGGGGGASITVVANYSALPAAGTVTGEFYWCSAAQGTWWLPGSLGGTYYNSGLYYSNGVSWERLEHPYNATQAEVNTGTNTDKFVTPDTFTNATKWGTKADLNGIVSQSFLASQFEIGHASDTSLTRVSAGVAAIEGKNIALNGTSEVLTTGTIELGAASDTTLSRSAAGVLAVEGVVIPSISSTNTLTNKRITKRVVSVASSATPTFNTDNGDIAQLTGLATAITNASTNLTGTPTHGQLFSYEITDNGTARAITWGSSFSNSGTLTLPTTTVISTLLRVLFQWNSTTSKWEVVAVV